MSYILDALRKAEADRERQRGAVPDLRSQMVSAGPAAEGAVARGHPGWLWPLLGAGLVLVAGGAWLWWGEKAPAPAIATKAPAAAGGVPTAASNALAAVAAPPSAAVVPPPQLPALAAAPAVPVAPPPAAAVPRATAATPPGAVPPPAKVAAAAPPARPVPRPAKTAQPADASRSVAGAARKAEPAPVAQAAASVAATRLPRLNELPEDLQRQVPALAIGGSVYSPQAERRMVVVNGQVLQEGASLGPELQLQQIGPKSAVMSIRGQRFEVPL
jgi:general secretion pathway protein B